MIDVRQSSSMNFPIKTQEVRLLNNISECTEYWYSNRS